MPRIKLRSYCAARERTRKRRVGPNSTNRSTPQSFFFSRVQYYKRRLHVSFQMYSNFYFYFQFW